MKAKIERYKYIASEVYKAMKEIKVTRNEEMIFLSSALLAHVDMILDDVDGVVSEEDKGSMKEFKNYLDKFGRSVTFADELEETLSRSGVNLEDIFRQKPKCESCENQEIFHPTNTESNQVH